MASNVRELIAKLDHLAAHPGTPAEGVAAKAKAAELRKKHNISEFTTKREQIYYTTTAFGFDTGDDTKGYTTFGESFGKASQNYKIEIDFVAAKMSEFIEAFMAENEAVRKPKVGG